MKITKETIAILKNFALINNSIVFDELNIIKTSMGQSSGTANVMAVADIPEEFPPCAIYDLGKFLAALNLFDLEEMEITFDKKYVILKDGPQTFKINKADPENIPNYRKNLTGAKIKNPAVTYDTSFELTEDMLKTIKKAASTLNVKDKHLKIDIKDGAGLISVTNFSNSASDIYARTFDAHDNKSGKIIIDLAELLVIDGNYTVSIASGTVLKLVNEDLNLLYQIMAIETE